jgi:hypothetical protein
MLPARWHLLVTWWIPAIKLTIFWPELHRNYSSTRIFHLASFKRDATQGNIIMIASVTGNITTCSLLLREGSALNLKRRIPYSVLKKLRRIASITCGYSSEVEFWAYWAMIINPSKTARLLNCCWPSLTQRFLIPSPMGPMTTALGAFLKNWI